ncbi:MAG: glycosidase [Chloroflexi bacterium RBG_16_70_13]|nr:MAG: glycosidase [Chloroflexi bacterium RBG_16_70_13]
MTRPTDVFVRSEANPILTVADVPYPANSVFNPGAATVGGETILLVRVEDLRGMSQLHVARSADGISSWRFDRKPLLSSRGDQDPEETWGCEDPRLTWLPEREEWAIAYTAYSRRGPLVSLAMTRDFRRVRRLGPAMPPEDKDAALFPRRFGGRWAMIHRPSPLRGGAHMWISYSPDLRHWGDHKLLLEARDGAWWDAGKIGLGPPPLETPDGWLVMYHGVHATADGPIYRVGLALLDLENPGVVLHRTDEWTFGPTSPYEITGDVGRVVFPCGWTLDEAADRLRLYYGAADSVIGLATARFSEVMAIVRAAPVPGHGRAADTASR